MKKKKRFFIKKNTLWKGSGYLITTALILSVAQISELFLSTEGKSLLPLQAAHRNLAHSKESVRAFLETYHLTPKKDASSLVISLNLLPEDASYYQELQTEIASLIPLEENRPTIDLWISRSPHPKQVPHSIGLSGGTGPLSDARFLLRLLNTLAPASSFSSRIHWDQFAIHLLSAPPPRSFFKRLFPWRYYLRMRNFAQSGHDEYFLVSNSAHRHSKMFRYLLGHSSFRLKDLVQSTANEIVQLLLPEGSTEILILGTLQMWRDNIYEKALNQTLDALSLKANSPPPRIQVEQIPLRRDAVALDALIQQTKEGLNRSLPVENWIFDLIQKKDLSSTQDNLVIVLACTEISLALGETGLQDLKSKLKGIESRTRKIQVVDSEEFFIKKVAENIRRMLNLPHFEQ